MPSRGPGRLAAGPRRFRLRPRARAGHGPAPLRPRQRLGRPDPQEDDRRGEGRPDDRLPLHGRVPQRRQRVYPRARIARLEVRDRRPDPLRARARLRDGRARQRLPEAGQGAAPHGLRFRAGRRQPGHGRDPLPAAHGARARPARRTTPTPWAGSPPSRAGPWASTWPTPRSSTSTSIPTTPSSTPVRSAPTRPSSSRLAERLHPRRPGQRHDRHGQALPGPRRHARRIPTASCRRSPPTSTASRRSSSSPSSGPSTPASGPS